jgi:hypothetical protein
VYARLTAAASAGSGKGKASSKSKATQGAGAGASSEALSLLYVTPERVVQSKRFMGKLEKVYEVRTVCR